MSTVGGEKHLAELPHSSSLVDLMSVVEEKTGVPVDGQKLILNGKSFTSMDRDKSLQELRFKNKCKVMVLGKRFDPQTDEKHKEVKDVRAKSFGISKRFAEVNN